ncbi:MAG TPA: VOC family protein [Gemmatimonadaceae bacterium]|jgi:catechol 2,3-dioxygenase-like lactoylglutathione lyase family enzyme|nr:VOC family protein [Gemmatimonadaceae bacterium]
MPLELLETCLYVSDLSAAERFYVEVLGLRTYARNEGRSVFFRCGDRMLLLFDPARTRIKDSAVPTHGAEGPGHAAFAVPDNEIDAWRERLAAHGVPIEQEVAWPRGGRSLYFRDPAGNSVEIVSPALWGISESSLFQ